MSDNGTEFTSMAILRWCQETGVEWHYIAPGKPTRNAFVESFNDASGKSASTTRCSRRSSRPAAPSPHGRRTTTATDPTPSSATSRPPSSPQIRAGKTGRMRPEMKPRTLPHTGAEKSLSSLYMSLSSRCSRSMICIRHKRPPEVNGERTNFLENSYIGRDNVSRLAMARRECGRTPRLTRTT